MIFFMYVIMALFIIHDGKTYIDSSYVICFTLCIISFHVFLIVLLIGALKNTFAELNDIYRKYHAQKLCMKELYKNNM